jgi:hypothetical protein
MSTWSFVCAVKATADPAATVMVAAMAIARRYSVTVRLARMPAS